MKQTRYILAILAVVICSLGLLRGEVWGQTAVSPQRPNQPATTLVPLGATWKYLDNGSDQGTAWRNPAFDDSSWPSGAAEIGYGDGDETTIVGYGSDGNNKYTTTYFRHSFNVADASTIAYLNLSVIRDDGVVVYLNGTELLRDNLPGGAITYLTTASSAIGGSSESTAVTSTVATNGVLVNGNNVLAVEIHQANGTSSDISFNLQLEVGTLTQFVQLMWSGGITSSSAQVNAKLSIPSNTVRLIVSQSADLSNPIASGFATASVANNNVAPLTITGLTPNTAYYYAIEAEGVIDSSKIGQFHTFGNGAFSYTFAMAGDATLGSTSPIYTTIRDQNPLFFLNPGDFFYADIGINDRNLFRAAFDASVGSTTQSQLYQQVPIAYVWDDHDFGPNNADGTSPSREAARLTYQEYVPHYPLGAGSGDVPIYQAFTVGRTRFIMLDLRSARTPSSATDDASKTMMGAAQKAWFKQQLLDANGAYPLIFIVGSVPWISSSSSDTWAGYTTERRELADFIKDNNIHNLVMLSADAHMLALDDGSNNSYATGGGASFPVFHAAALDRGGSIKGGPYTHGPFSGTGQFALVTVTDNNSSQICVAYSGLLRDSTTGNLTELIGWSDCYYLTAVSPTVTPTINTTTSTSLDLAWDSNPANCTYEVHSDTTPYFSPSASTLLNSGSGSSATVPLAVGSPSTNHYYWVRAVNCDGSETAVSNHVAEFDFALIPGSP